MLYWDTRITAAKTKARLGRMSEAARVSFATGSLAHALDEVSVTPRWRDEGPLCEALRDVLEAVWKQVASGLRPRSLRERARTLSRLLPNEDGPSKPGLADLVDGVSELCRLVDKPSALAAVDVASFAYQAVASIALPISQISGGEAKHAAAEQACVLCVAEIQFQLDYVERLEHMVAPFTYDRVTASMTSSPSKGRR